MQGTREVLVRPTWDGRQAADQHARGCGFAAAHEEAVAEKADKVVARGAIDGGRESVDGVVGGDGGRGHETLGLLLEGAAGGYGGGVDYLQTGVPCGICLHTGQCCLQGHQSLGGLVTGCVCDLAALVKDLTLVRGVKQIDTVRAVQSKASLLGGGESRTGIIHAEAEHVNGEQHVGRLEGWRR